MKTSFKVNSTEYDLDSSLTFTFSFDVLKKILIGLNSRNEQLSEKVSDLTKKYDDLKKSTDNDKKYIKESNDKFYRKLHQIEKIFKSIPTNKKGNINDLEHNNLSEKEEKIDTLSINKETIQSKDKYSNDSSFSNSFDYNDRQNSNINNKDIMNVVNSRINDIELKLKNYALLVDMNSINIQHNECNNKLKEYEFSLNNMKLKIEEFDIQDIFQGAKMENGNIDGAKLLYLSLEKQIKSKFDLTDLMQIQINKDFSKLKSLVETYKFDNVNEYNMINEQINIIFKQINEMRNKYSNNPPNIVGSQLDNENELKIMNENNGQEFKKAVSLLKLKVKDIEKSLKKLTVSFDPDIMIKDISTLQSNIEQKASREDMAKVKEHLISLENTIIPLKDSYEKNDEEIKKSSSSIILIMKKLENLHSVINAKTSYENNAKLTKSNGENSSKYMEISLFNDFIRVFNREVDRLKKDYDDLYKKTEVITGELRTKAIDVDLKSVEDYLNTKIEDFKLLTHKKYADRIDSQKNFKYLEMQIRQIIDVSYKTTNNDKGDNWLIAKKPIGGFSCASCESYIGDLQEKKEYVPWNKYPNRVEGMEQTMRTGNGFSRMLHMININQSNNKDNENKDYKNAPAKLEQEDNKIYESDGEVTTKSLENKKKSLPKLNNYRSTGELGMYTSEDNNKINQENNINIFSTSKDETQINKLQDELQPKL